MIRMVAELPLFNDTQPKNDSTIMLILGIESSCDDTSVALIEAPSSPCRRNLPGEETGRASLLNKSNGENTVNFSILAEKTASQIEVHKKYGGVVPEIAGRMHAENIMPLVEEVLKHANIQTSKHTNIDAIAVTSGPGLITGLLVGVETAKALSYLWNIPLIEVNHISGHIHSVQIQNSECRMQNNEIKFPAICLIVSGGHTELLLMKSHDEFELLGKTRDDAAGETFDKVAKLIGFDYPGGAKISQTAEGGNVNAINFPRPMINEGYEFSFAGLKTSALYWLRDNAKSIHSTNNPTSYKLQSYPDRRSRILDSKGIGTSLQDFCASFETSIIDVLVTKTLRATKEFKPKTIILGGGVSANKKLRSALQEEITKYFSNSKFQIPNSKYCMDNAAMIAVAGYYKALKNEYTDWKDIEVDPNWTAYK